MYYHIGQSLQNKLYWMAFLLVYATAALLLKLTYNTPMQSAMNPSDHWIPLMESIVVLSGYLIWFNKAYHSFSVKHMVWLSLTALFVAVYAFLPYVWFQFQQFGLMILLPVALPPLLLMIPTWLILNVTSYFALHEQDARKTMAVAFALGGVLGIAFLFGMMFLFMGPGALNEGIPTTISFWTVPFLVGGIASSQGAMTLVHFSKHEHVLT